MIVRLVKASMAGVAVICALGQSATAAVTPHPGCKHNPAVIGRCYWLHGTMSISADSATVLGADGTHQAVAVRYGPNSKWDGPANLNAAWEKAQRDTGFVSAWVHGTFEVCPIPSDAPDRPWQKFVCIESATDLGPERAGERH